MQLRTRRSMDKSCWAFQLLINRYQINMRFALWLERQSLRSWTYRPLQRRQDVSLGYGWETSWLKDHKIDGCIHRRDSSLSLRLISSSRVHWASTQWGSERTPFSLHIDVCSLPFLVDWLSSKSTMLTCAQLLARSWTLPTVSTQMLLTTSSREVMGISSWLSTRKYCSRFRSTKGCRETWAGSREL